MTSVREPAEQALSIGRTLHARRRRRRVSMERAAAETRIRRDYLVAMEQDDFSFEAPVYVRGLLSNYARFLRLEPDPLLERLQEDSASSRDGASALAERATAWTGALRTPSAALPLIVTACALIILTAMALWDKASDERTVQRGRDSVEASELDAPPLP